jgi:lysophospholipase L1-like esterase
MAFVPLTGAAQQSTSPQPGAKYVAIGSSFAAGPTITKSADSPANRCARSIDNYPHQIARKHGLNLVDVSCAGAKTEHLLGPWDELKPQLDAVDPDTRLVTITIGGNDMALNARLAARACQTAFPVASAGPCSPLPPMPTDKDWSELETHMRRLAEEVHRRSPAARVVFVDYTTILPPTGTCPALSLTAQQADEGRSINQRVVEITARAARATGSDLVTASALTADHHACAAVPWAAGFFRREPGMPAAFHPRLEAHTAIALAIERLIWH